MALLGWAVLAVLCFLGSGSMVTFCYMAVENTRMAYNRGGLHYFVMVWMAVAALVFAAAALLLPILLIQQALTK